MNLHTAINEFLITQKIKGNSEKTLEYYSNILQYFSDFLGDVDMDIMDWDWFDDDE